MNTKSVPAIGITGVLADPDRGSRVPSCMADAFSNLGIYAGYREAFPFLGAKLTRLWLLSTGRSGDLASLMLSKEMRIWARTAWAWERLTTPGSVDAWVLCGAARSVRGKYATLTDQSPYQILHPSQRPSVLLYPSISERQLRSEESRSFLTYRRAYVSCVFSHWAARSLVEDVGIHPDRVRVVGAGVGEGHDPSQISLERRDWDLPVFLFVGFDWKRKNGDAVIRAFRAIRDSEPRATLHVVGNHSRICEEGVFGHGVLSRHQTEDRQTLNQLFAEATCFVMPSLVEPFGHVYVEAGSVGVGSIGTTEGGASDAIGAGGILVDPHDYGALVKAMRSYCNPSFAADKGAKALAHSKLLSWDLVAQRVLRALDVSIPGIELADFLCRDIRESAGFGYACGFHATHEAGDTGCDPQVVGSGGNRLKAPAR